MSYSGDPFGRRRRPPTGGQPGRPTLEDFQALAKAYQELKQSHETAQQQLVEIGRELEIKNEALQRQSADFKNLQSELVWAKAALSSQEPRRPTGQSDNHADGDGPEWKNRFMRLQADFDNMRKRLEQRLETEAQEARHRILLDMLPLADHLELAMRHGEALSDPEGREFLRNVEATQRAFLDTLRRYQVEPVAAMGQTFDPEIHEAVGHIHQEHVPPDTVVQVIRSGYREGSKLLRPARVLISRNSPTE